MVGWPQSSYVGRAHCSAVLRYIRCVVMVIVAAMIVWLPAATAAPTVQDFNVPEGTPYEAKQTHNPPAPSVIPGGPTGTGQFLRLASAMPEPTTPSSNTITFPSTAPPADLIVADFDFRMTPGNAVTPGKGRADGFGFVLLNRAFFAGPTVEPQGPLFAAEEPNFTGSFSIGFDIYRNPPSPSAPGYPVDIGNDNIRGPFVLSNSISIHLNGRLIEQVDASRVVDLAGGQWIHARIILRPGGGFADLTVILTPQDCQPFTLVKNLRVPRLTPYEARVHFGARAGGETAHHDLDNIKVQFLKLTRSVLSFSATSYTVEETAPAAVVTISRIGDTNGPVQVQYATADITATAGTDYTAQTGILTFGPRKTKKSFTVPILNDATAEKDKTFEVLLKQPGGGAVVGGPSTAIVKIFDDEGSRSVGHWSPIMCWPIVAVHMHLLPTGKVMLWDRLGDVVLWDPGTQKITTPSLPDDNLFCSGHAFLENGQLLVTGGHHPHGDPADDGIGLLDAKAYNPFTDSWTALPNMNAGRWYPTNSTLANGDMLVISGSKDTHFNKNPLPQVWQAATGAWRNIDDAQAHRDNARALGADLYPRMFLTPQGQVFKAGADQETWFLDTSGGGTWTQGPNSRFGRRVYGAAVMYVPGEILIVGGGDVGTDAVGVSTDDATAMAEVIDLNVAEPAWREVASMTFARQQLNATLLPDGKVLATGGVGGPGFNNEANPVLHAELWDPATEEWTKLPAMQVTRGYHSTALLLPDGRVIVAGGGQGAGATGVNNNAEMYLPAYLFKGPRPTVTAAPAVVTYGETFAVQTPNAENVTGVSLIRLASVTHAFDQNQRFNWLHFSPGTSSLSVTAPALPNLAPPGHYMLFILNEQRVPSVASIVQIISSD